MAKAPVERITVILADGRQVSALRTHPLGTPTGVVFVYAPGAASSLHDPFGRFAAERLTAAGLAVVRFQFPYMEAGTRRVDTTSLLEATWYAVLASVQPQSDRIIAAGRSMGGRIASQVVAQGAPASGLALFAYPLHPPGRPDRRRDRHLSLITVPTLLCSGTRDAFATPGELEAVVGSMPRAELHLLEGADHGFGALKSSGRIREDMWAEATQALLDWIERI